MQLISTLEEINKLKITKNSTSNVYWSKAELSHVIEQRKLFLLYDDGRNACWAIADSELRNRFYFQIEDKNFSKDRFFFSGEYVAELIFNISNQEKTERERCLLKNLGFSYSSTANMMCLRNKELWEKTPVSSRLQICRADISDYGYITQLFDLYFDPLTDAVPVKNELIKAISEQNVWIVEYDGSVAGCLCLEAQGKTAWIRHVVIDEEKRGQGLAKTLISWILSYESNISEYRLWVKNDNIAAINLYNSLGFEKTNRFLEMWIRKVF